MQKYRSFRDFYPFYLSEHTNRTSRRLHFAGSFLVLLLTAFAIVLSEPRLLYILPVVGYGFAWVGHFFFERNRPATFQYPLYSLLGDWVMFWQILTRKLAF